MRRIKDSMRLVNPNMNFNSLFELEKQVKLLKQAILLPKPITSPYLFKNSQPCSSILFYGPSGTGKTCVAEAVAAEISLITIFSVSGSNLISKYQGETKQFLDTLFKYARSKKSSLIFFDENDSFGLSRTNKDQ